MLVPCFNAANYIDRFLMNLSLLDRSFDEVIFYDDASTDQTKNLLMSKGHRVISGEKNMGPAYARNMLVTHASHDWIHFHDIDDAMVPSYLTKTAVLAEIDQHDVILCNVDWRDRLTNELVMNWKYDNSQINHDPLKYTISHPIGGINGLYRKSKITEVGGFNSDLRIWEDADLHVRLASKAVRFYVIEEVLSIAFRTANSASSDQTLGWLNRLKLLENYQQQFTEYAIQQEIGQQAQSTAARLLLSGEGRAAKRALQLSEKSAVKVPVARSLLWRFLKNILPGSLRIELRLLHLQFAFRKHYH
ncbi:glycosyltransferase family 2 protein [Pedobacter duraquae]|uniref:glycosyltransferase family 2 protein n=1 Tax=Pedobacter duraquae TaxID=425511 RepID=UPI0021CE4D74|nr:glycosyltransferase family A protein [Pedobacter duraquae]